MRRIPMAETVVVVWIAVTCWIASDTKPVAASCLANECYQLSCYKRGNPVNQCYAYSLTTANIGRSNNGIVINATTSKVTTAPTMTNEQTASVCSPECTTLMYGRASNCGGTLGVAKATQRFYCKPNPPPSYD